jgi:hypothetical protein
MHMKELMMLSLLMQKNDKEAIELFKEIMRLKEDEQEEY